MEAGVAGEAGVNLASGTGGVDVNQVAGKDGGSAMNGLGREILDFYKGSTVLFPSSP